MKLAERALVACGALGLALLVCGLPMLLVPSERAMNVKRYNDAAIRLMENPPLAFVPSERQARGLDPMVVGTVSTGTGSANLTIVEHAGRAMPEGAWDLVRGSRWLLTATLNYTINRTIRDGMLYETVADSGMTFTFGNRSFHRAFPFQAEALGYSAAYCGINECSSPYSECQRENLESYGDRRMAGGGCTRARLERACQMRSWTNYTGASQCDEYALCGRCVEYVYPVHLCTVVDVSGFQILPSATFQSCYYPFDLSPNRVRNFGDEDVPALQYMVPVQEWVPQERTRSDNRTVRITVLPSTDPSLVLERLTKGGSFGSSQETRKDAGLGLTITGGAFFFLAITLTMMSRLRGEHPSTKQTMPQSVTDDRFALDSIPSTGPATA